MSLTKDDVAALRTQIQQDEGLRLTPYRDTNGKLSIGYGRNLTDRGISPPEADLLLDHDLTLARSEVLLHCPWTSTLDGPRHAVLVAMAYNMGMTRVLEFTQTLAAVEAGRYEDAARAMMDSRWATQVGNRARRLAAQMRGTVL